MSQPHITARSNWRAAAWLAVVLATLLAGCAQPGPLPAGPVQRTASEVGLAPQASAATPWPTAQWWREFGDPALDALVTRALADQPSLQVAAARIARAAAAVDERRASQGPSLSLGLDVSAQRYTEHGLYPPPIAGSVRESLTGQFNANWEMGFFGRHQAALQAALGTQQALLAEQQSARALLATQVVRAWVALARQAEQKSITEELLAARTQAVGLMRERQAAGLDNAVELRQAESSPPELRQQIEALQEQMTLSRHQLAALSAQPPQALATALPALAPLQVNALPDRLGADLLGRRADIVAARWRVEAATQDEALARAQFMPDVNLFAFAGLASLGLDHFIDLGSRNFSGGAALRLPLFDGGRLNAQLGARHADLGAAVAAYNGAVLDAVRQAADAATTLRSLQAQQREQSRSLAALEHAWMLARQRADAGLSNRLPALGLQGQVLAQRRNAIELRARVLDAQAQLMHALGGGYQDTGADPQLGRNVAVHAAGS